MRSVCGSSSVSISIAVGLGVWQESEPFSFIDTDRASLLGGLIFDSSDSSGNLEDTATGGAQGG